MCPPAKIITISTEPMAKGAKSPASFGLATTHPMVSTRKKVPMSSTMYFFIAIYSPGRSPITHIVKNDNGYRSRWRVRRYPLRISDPLKPI